MNLFVSILPIILPLVLLVLVGLPGKKGMPISSAVFIVFAFLIWKMEAVTIFASVIQGVHQGLTILLILFGALVLLNTLKNTGAVTRINNMFISLSGDMRVQVVMLAWLFGSLIEGAAGFGTPAAVVGPLLLLLGFKPIAAATLALVGDSVAVSFGAISTPITVGIGNLTDEAGLSEIGQLITLMDLMVGIFLPLILVFILTQIFTKKERSIKSFVEMIPWSMLIGFTYVISAIFCTHFLGNDFTSILSPLVAMVVASITAKYNILLPKTEWKDALEHDVKQEPSDMSLLSAWSPYIIVVGLLLITRLVPVIKDFTQNNFITDLISLENILDTSISSSWQILYSPGTVLVVAAIIASFSQSRKASAFAEASKLSFKSLLNPFIVLSTTLSMVYVFRNSAINTADLSSMPAYLAETLSVVGSSWFVLAPFIGQLGSFITGSATVSTLTFAPIQSSVAASVGLSQSVILAEQVMGGAIGNMYCVHNVVAASTVVGEEGKEGEIIKVTIIPALILGVLTAIAAAVLMFVFGR